MSSCKCAALLLAIGTTGAAAQSPEPVRLTHAELLASVARTSDGLATHTLPTGPNAVALQVRRERTGEVEIHDGKEDIFVTQAGRAGRSFRAAD